MTELEPRRPPFSSRCPVSDCPIVTVPPEAFAGKGEIVVWHANPRDALSSRHRNHRRLRIKKVLERLRR